MIPQGPTGSTGPMEPAEPSITSTPGLLSYGGKYNYNLSTINITAACQDQISLYDSTTVKNLNYRELNSITIENNGIYEITYAINATPSSNATLTACVREDRNDILSTVNIIEAVAGKAVTFFISTIYSLRKGNIIDLALASDVDIEVKISNNASLIIKQLD